MKARIVNSLNILFMNKSHILKKFIKKTIIATSILLFILLIRVLNLRPTNVLLGTIKASIYYEFSIVEDSKRIFKKGMELIESSERVLEVFNLSRIDKYAAPLQGNIHRNYHKETNKGLDIKADIDYEPKAIEAGIITDVRLTDSKGFYVNIQSDDFQHIYGYLSKSYVVIGDTIESGEPIGYLGTNKDGYKYLRFEIMKDGEYENPSNYIEID